MVFTYIKAIVHHKLKANLNLTTNVTYKIWSLRGKSYSKYSKMILNGI